MDGMATRDRNPLQGEMLQGTLDLLILQTLVLGPAHGHTIAHAIERGSEEVLQVEHGSLYPACTGWRTAAGSPPFGGPRRTIARPLLPSDRRRAQAVAGTGQPLDRLVRAVNRVLRPVEE